MTALTVPAGALGDGQIGAPPSRGFRAVEVVVRGRNGERAELLGGRAAQAEIVRVLKREKRLMERRLDALKREERIADYAARLNEASVAALTNALGKTEIAFDLLRAPRASLSPTDPSDVRAPAPAGPTERAPVPAVVPLDRGQMRAALRALRKRTWATEKRAPTAEEIAEALRTAGGSR
jgi:hypothetical protein